MPSTHVVFEGLKDVKKDIEEIIISHKSLIESKILNESLEKEKIDITLPGRPILRGGIHPISKTMDEIISILGVLGFNVRRRASY